MILYKSTNSPVCRVCVLGVVLLIGAGQARAESFLSVIKHLVMTSNSGHVPVRYSASGKSPASELDWVSEECVGCHNGVNATDIALKSAGSRHEFSGHQSPGHPVGMDYRDYAHTLPFEYRPMEALTTGIDFVDGKVSCVSCHRSNTIIPKKPAVAGNWQNVQVRCPSSRQLNSGPGGVGLCQACHIM